ncbi:Phospholipase D, partial [Halocaridina rubra]
DEEFEDGIMNGHKYDSGVFAGSMRKYLFCEHLGLADDDEEAIRKVMDPVCDEFFTEKWCTIAATNTRTFEEVFSCYPCDSAKTFEDVNRLRNKSSLADIDPSEAHRRLKNIKGHLVQFPLEFLCDEMLKPGVGTKEYLLPMEMWT